MTTLPTTLPSTMSERDQLNLQFLLSASAATLQDWYDHVDEDDHQYATELLDAHARFLSDRIAELATERNLDALGDHFPEVKQVLTRFFVD